METELYKITTLKELSDFNQRNEAVHEIDIDLEEKIHSPQGFKLVVQSLTL
jgi:hypothetical protein